MANGKTRDEGRKGRDEPGLPPAPAEAVGLAERLPLPALVKRGEWKFDISPDEDLRKRIAAHYDLVRLPELRFVGSIRRAGDEDWLLEGMLTGRVVQPCGVTLEDVETRIEEPVVRLYQAGFDLRKAPSGETETPEEEIDVEPLGGVIDLGAVLLEAFDLALPPFPRAPGAELEQSEARPAQPEAKPDSPFAALAGIIGERPAGKDGPTDEDDEEAGERPQEDKGGA